MMDDARTPTADELAKPVPRLIGHLHAFRAVTIVMIVAVHVWAVLYFFNSTLPGAGMPADLIAATLEMVLHNSTIFFAMISGILFGQVLEGRGWARFFSSKLRNVALPYAVVTLLYLLFALSQEQYFELYSGSITALPGEFVADYFHRDEQANAILWYMPVLLGLFAITPLVVALLRSRLGPVAIAAMLLAPLYFSRTWPDFSWANFVYFLGPYAAGIYFGAPDRYPRFLDAVRRFKWLFIAVLLVASLAVYPTIAAPTIEGSPFKPFEAAAYVQKMALAPLLLLWLHRFDRAMPRVVSRLADDSFAIYFLHMWGVFAVYGLVDTSLGPVGNPWLLVAITFGGTIAICAVLLVLIGLLRRLLGKWSRPLIGA